jgi:hypothetical protein
MWDVVRIVIALGVALLIVRAGVALLGGMTRPVPEPPPPGELRKVKLVYRCSTCGTEVRMTSAVHTEPEAPRHCMDEMDLLTPVDDI